MGFQTTVSTALGIGTPGLEVNPGQATYTAFQYASDGTAVAGGFAFTSDGPKDSSGSVINAGGEGFNFAGATGTTLIGFVARNQIGLISTYLAESSEVYQAGAGLSIAKRGQFYAVATGEATAGQAVICDPATGTITYGTAGATNDTGWRVVLSQGATSAAEGDIVIYENLGVDVVSASA